VRVIAHGVPDRFIEQASRARQLAVTGLDATGIAARVKELRQADSRGARLRAG
jgi:deoxyxylulose-5-phosphate synthase